MEYIALGNFDGIQLGHKALINSMVEKASKDNAIPSVCIFDPHPMRFLFPEKAPKQIASVRFKKELLHKLGIRKVHVLKFDEYMHQMNGIDFLDMLKDKYDIGLFAVGYNYNFGMNGAWDKDDIVDYCNINNIESIIFDKYLIEKEEVSSTKVREFIREGNLDKAKQLLGRPHIIEGKVVEGAQQGRKIDFPTANILFEEDFLYPPHGVYLTATNIDDTWNYSITNIGAKPTVSMDIINIETHIFDHCSDLYGKRILIGFLEKLRDQIKFDDIFQLKKQLINDSKLAKKLTKKYPLDF